jgi:hypothetical protein
LGLLLDEMYAGLKEHFEVLGWEVETVQEAGLGGARTQPFLAHHLPDGPFFR